VFRSSRNVLVTLVGAASLFGCCLTSCVRCDNLPERDAAGNIVHDANGNVVYRRHCNYHPFGHTYSHGYTFWHSSPYSGSSYSSSTSSGGTHSMSGTTGRGGFGSTGGATAGS
jgi:hypothetical protein